MEVPRSETPPDPLDIAEGYFVRAHTWTAPTVAQMTVAEGFAALDALNSVFDLPEQDGDLTGLPKTSDTHNL